MEEECEQQCCVGDEQPLRRRRATMEQERSSQGASDEQLFRKRRAAMEQATSSIRGGDERHGTGDEQRDE